MPLVPLVSGAVRGSKGSGKEERGFSIKGSGGDVMQLMKIPAQRQEDRREIGSK
jgi:hypothetical protein